jgi:hypothetical protein
MPKKIVRYKCKVCGYDKHKKKKHAEACEELGKPEFLFKDGDTFIHDTSGTIHTIVDRYISRRKVAGGKPAHTAQYHVSGARPGKTVVISQKSLLKRIEQYGWRHESTE